MIAASAILLILFYRLYGLTEKGNSEERKTKLKHGGGASVTTNTFFAE